jgi:hypothetical protein
MGALTLGCEKTNDTTTSDMPLLSTQKLITALNIALKANPDTPMERLLAVLEERIEGFPQNAEKEAIEQGLMAAPKSGAAGVFNGAPPAKFASSAAEVKAEKLGIVIPPDFVGSGKKAGGIVLADLDRLLGTMPGKKHLAVPKATKETLAHVTKSRVPWSVLVGTGVTPTGKNGHWLIKDVNEAMKHIGSVQPSSSFTVPEWPDPEEEEGEEEYDE